MRKEFERAFEDAVVDSSATAGRALLWKLVAAALIDLRRDLEVDVPEREYTVIAEDGPVPLTAVDLRDVFDIVDRHIRRSEHEEVVAKLEM